MAAMRKQFNLLKQFADQTFQKTERSEVLTEQLASTEKRVELVRQCCSQAAKYIASCLQGIGTIDNGSEKRPRRLPEVLLTQNMLDSSIALGETSLLGSVLQHCSEIQGFLAREQLAYETETEQHFLGPLLASLEEEGPNIAKLRKQLGKLTNEMDQAKSKYNTAANYLYQESDINTIGKIDILRSNYQDSRIKVEHCRDSLAAEMFGLLSKEPDMSSLFVSWYKLQAGYHHTVATMLDDMLPALELLIEGSHQKPMFGLHLAEHLASTGREISFVIEACICYLLEYGMEEEGLFRVAGSASKIKKFKGAIDAGFLDILDVRDPHTVTGLLKMYLRMLPEPLMSYGLYDKWMTAVQIQDHDQKLRALWEVTNMLPNQNLNNLRYIIKFLAKLTDNSSINKMTSQNIAIVMAPNLIWPMNDTFMSNTEDNIKANIALAGLHTSLVDVLITYSDYFFPEEIEFAVNTVLIPKSPSLSSSNLHNMSRSCSSDNSSSCGDVTIISEDSTLSKSGLDNGRTKIRKRMKKQAPPIPTSLVIPEDTSPVINTKLRRNSSSDKEDNSSPKKPPRRQSIDSTDSSRLESSGDSCGSDSPKFNSLEKSMSHSKHESPVSVRSDSVKSTTTSEQCPGTPQTEDISSPVNILEPDKTQPLNRPDLTTKPPIANKPMLNGRSLSNGGKHPLPVERKSLKLNLDNPYISPIITPPPTPFKPKFNVNTEDTKL